MTSNDRLIDALEAEIAHVKREMIRVHNEWKDVKNKGLRMTPQLLQTRYSTYADRLEYLMNRLDAVAG